MQSNKIKTEIFRKLRRTNNKMTKKQIKKLREVKRDRITWTGSIAFGSILVFIICFYICLKAISGSTVDFLKSSEVYEMPDLVGLTRSEIENNETASNLKLTFEEVYSNTATNGKSFYQSVEAGQEVTNNQPIKIRISKGAQEVQVPDVTDINVKEAEQILNNLGLNYKLVYIISGETSTSNDDNANSSNKSTSNSNGQSSASVDNTSTTSETNNDDSSENILQPQTIVYTEPAAFETVQDGTVITVYVRRPYLSTTRVVPNVTGQSKAGAAAMMAQANVSNYGFYYEASDQAVDTVISYWPRGTVSVDDKIWVKLSGGPLYGLGG